MTAVEAMERDEQRAEQAAALSPVVSLKDEISPLQRPLLSLRAAVRGPGSIQPCTERHSEIHRRTLPQELSMGRQAASCRQLSITPIRQCCRIMFMESQQ